MRNNKFHFGYCALTADCLHIGHIEFLERCKEHCYFLIVGLMTDTCVKKYKSRKPLMNYEQRKKIVNNLRMVNLIIAQDTFEFPKGIITYKMVHPGEIIIFDSEQYKGKRYPADYYFPYNNTISSTKMKKHYANSDNSKRKI